MASKRIAKSATDWAKMSKLVPEYERANYAAFKARSDGYLTKVLSLPENPPQINFSAVKARVSNPALVDEIEKAYKAVKIVYPKDNKSHEVDEQERQALAQADQFEKLSTNRKKEIDEMINKFKVMIPYEEMTAEDWALTFPDWSVNYREPSIWPHPDKAPGLTAAERKHYRTPDDPPYSIADR